MTAICLTFNTLDFAKKLEAVGVEPRVAEVYANLQAELQAQVLEKFEEYRPTLDEIKITKHELATKSDIAELKHEIDNVRYEMHGLRSELIIKLGSIVVGTAAILGVMVALFH